MKRWPRPERGAGTWATVARGLRLSPELRVGLGVTVLLALFATAGRIVVPVTLQQVVDRGLVTGGADLGLVVRLSAAALVAVGATALASAAMNARLARVTEEALTRLRVRAFRHLHDLSALALAAQQRGALVARVTDDIDTISRFMQWGGVMLLVNTGQLVLATSVMLVYSPPLTLLVLGTFAPLVIVIRWFSGRLERAYGQVRVRVGAMLATLSETVVGAEVIRAYGAGQRTQARVDGTVGDHERAAYRAARLAALMFASGETVAAVATAGVVVAGVQLGVAGEISEGRLLSFLFLTTLFVGPVQILTEVLDQAQTAVAGWRRVLDLLEREPDVRDPAGEPAGEAVDLPSGPIEVRFASVSFTYPARAGAGGQTRPALTDVDLVIAPRTRVAVVGETGSGKSTFARLLTRLVDPTRGAVLLNGVDLRRVAFASLRRRVVLVPQDGFLYAASIAENVAAGREGASGADVAAAFTALGLDGWLSGLPAGIDTPAGERGSELSAGERQLVALARAYVADPELLVLDEATSAVDPATEAVLAAALDRLTAGRTSVTIAHRMSTALSADEVLVMDGGRVVQRGSHARLVRQEGPYARLFASWSAGTRADVRPR